MPIVNDVHKMGLHDTCIVSKEYISAIRVPGGWIYTISKGLPGQTFVPYSEEFNKNTNKGKPMDVTMILSLMREYAPEEIEQENLVLNISGSIHKGYIKLQWIFEYEHHEYELHIDLKDIVNLPIILKQCKNAMKRLIK